MLFLSTEAAVALEVSAQYPSKTKQETGVIPNIITVYPNTVA